MALWLRFWVWKHEAPGLIPCIAYAWMMFWCFLTHLMLLCVCVWFFFKVNLLRDTYQVTSTKVNSQWAWRAGLGRLKRGVIHIEKKKPYIKCQKLNKGLRVPVISRTGVELYRNIVSVVKKIDKWCFLEMSFKNENIFLQTTLLPDILGK